MEFLALFPGTNSVEDIELHERAERSSFGGYSHQYLVRENGNEIAFLTLDFWPPSEHLVIYELFIKSSLRRKGYGTKILSLIEPLARKMGYKTIVLNAHPLDDSQQTALISWYERRGYRKDRGQKELMIKNLS